MSDGTLGAQEVDFSGVKGVYFDLDDTLCGYWDAAKTGLRSTFERHPVQNVSIEDSLDHWAAAFREFCPTLKQTGWYEPYLRDSRTTRSELMRLTLLRMGIEDSDLTEKLSQTYMEYRDSNLRLFPDAIELLDDLRGRLPLGLVTNGPADLQRMEIATLGIADRFEAIFIEGELGIGKPSPEVFRQAQLAMQLEPNELLFVGNSFGHDILPAIHAGWKTVWVRRPSDVPPSVRGLESKPEEHPLGAPSPTLIVTTLRSLLGKI